MYSCQSLKKPGASQLVYRATAFTGALPGTTHSSWCCSALATDAKSFRAPAILFVQKQPADVEQARGNRSSDSQPNTITLHLGLPHS